MENITLNDIYKHVLHIEKRLNRLEDFLQIPEIALSASEVKKHKATLKRMLEDKEGTDWAQYKKGRS